MTYTEMEHALYLRKKERQADRLVKTLQCLLICSLFAVALAFGTLIASLIW